MQRIPGKAAEQDATGTVLRRLGTHGSASSVGTIPTKWLHVHPSRVSLPTVQLQRAATERGRTQGAEAGALGIGSEPSNTRVQARPQSQEDTEPTGGQLARLYASGARSESETSTDSHGFRPSATEGDRERWTRTTALRPRIRFQAIRGRIFAGGIADSLGSKCIQRAPVTSERAAARTRHTLEWVRQRSRECGHCHTATQAPSLLSASGCTSRASAGFAG